MSDKVEEFQVLFMKRNARKRGQTSSENQNDMADEVAHDLTEINQQWNNRLVPLLELLPDGSEGNVDNAVDAFGDGLDGRTVFVDSTATISTEAAYFNNTADRPNSIKEQIVDIYQDITELREDLEAEIEDITITAAQVPITDSGSLYVASNVEIALAEVMTKANLALTGGGAISHSILEDLDADDHTQYLLADGTRELSANWNVGSFVIQLPTGSATVPSLAIGASDAGWYSDAANQISASVAGTRAWGISSTVFTANTTGGGQLSNSASSSSQPFVGTNDDGNTGITHPTADQIGILVGGTQTTVFSTSLIDTSTRLSNSAAVLNLGTSASTGHALVAGDVIIGGSLEVDGTTWIDGGIRMIQTNMLALDTDGDSGILATGDNAVSLQTAGTQRWLFAGTTRTSTRLFSLNANPLFLGAAATTSHSIGGNDVIVGGDFEVDGTSWLDGIVRFSSQIAPSAVTVNTPTGTIQTINWNSGNVQVLSLASATGNVTLTLSNPISGGIYMLKIIQHASSGHNVIWPTTKWPGGAAPTISTGAGAIDLVRLVWDGTAYLGTFNQAFA